jgi:serine/threonine protein kinase/WD40 repeat protein
MADWNPQANEIFLKAMEIEPPVERLVFVDHACGGDAKLRSQVDSLLQSAERAGSFLNTPTAAPKPAGMFDRTIDPPSETAGMMVGRYKLLQQIGEGGMGNVWLAQQSEPVKRKVAVKLIKLGMDSRQVLQRFEAERQALAMMDHPNIAKVLDGGLTQDGRPFFVMELVKGTPITDYCDACKLSLKERLELFIPACQAIQHAHQKGIIHRDIKPSNVMIALYDDKPVPKVIDFGVAKATGQSLSAETLNTGFGGVIGTPQYMSPEQATLNNLDIDTRSDVYSLGVLLYELLTGMPPFTKEELQQKGLMEVLRAVREDDPPKPSTKLSTAAALPTLSANRSIEPKVLMRTLRSELDWIVLKALEKNRSRRYETANGLAADVQRYLSGDSVSAHPPSASYRTKKFLRRHRTQVAAASLVLLALVGGIAGTTYGLIRADQQRRQADQARNNESVQRQHVVEEQARTQDALKKSQISEGKAANAEREALRQAANSGCDVAQQLCERNSVAQGLTEYGRALKFAHDAEDTDLEEVIRLNIDAWLSQMHVLAYKVSTPRGQDISPAAFSPDGKTLAVAFGNEHQSNVTVQLHNAPDGSPRTEKLTVEGPKRVYRLAWNAAGDRLAIYGGDGLVYIWKIGEDKPTLSLPVDPGGTFFARHTCPNLAFSPDGTRLIAGTSKSTCPIFDLSTGKLATVQLTDVPGSTGKWQIRAVDWSSDGAMILTGNTKGTASLWDANDGHLIRGIQAGKSTINAMHFGRDPSKFLCQCGNELVIWNTNTGEPAGPPVVSYEGVWDVQIANDDSMFVVGTDGAETLIHEVGGSRTVGAPIWVSDRATTLVGFHPDGRRLLTVVQNDISVWNLASEMRRDDVPLDDPEDRRLAPFLERYKIKAPKLETINNRLFRRNLALSPDGKLLIKYDFGHQDEGFDVIDTRTFAVIRHVPISKSIEKVYWRPDSRQFVVAGNTRDSIFDSATLEMKSQIGTSPTCARSGAYSPDGRRFSIGTWNYTLSVFDTSSWTRTGPLLPHTSDVCDSAFSRDGKIIITSDMAGDTRLWHAATGKRVGPVIAGSWPRVCTTDDAFIIVNNHKRQAYQIPAPIAGACEQVQERIEFMTHAKRAALVSTDIQGEPEDTYLSPAEARTTLNKTITVQMQVKSASMSSKAKWYYLNSEQDHASPDNFAIAVGDPSEERLKKMGLDAGNDKLKGIWVRATGEVTTHHGVVEMVVMDPSQLTIVAPPNTDDP